MDLLFNLIIIIAKKVIYLKRGKEGPFSVRYFETLLEIERESEEIYAVNNDSIELYERKWEKYLVLQ